MNYQLRRPRSECRCPAKLELSADNLPVLVYESSCFCQIISGVYLFRIAWSRSYSQSIPASLSENPTKFYSSVGRQRQI
jgi:hypothetical protein